MLFRFILMSFLVLPYFVYSGILSQCRQLVQQISRNSNDPVIRLENSRRLSLKKEKKIGKVYSEIKKLMEELQKTTDQEEGTKIINQLKKKIEIYSQLVREEQGLSEERMEILTQWGNQLFGTMDEVMGIISSELGLESKERVRLE